MLNTRIRSLLSFLTCMLIASGASAGADGLFHELERDGFVVTHVSKTWLGRTIIHTTNGAHKREIILERKTGRLIQDTWRPEDTSETAPSARTN